MRLLPDPEAKARHPRLVHRQRQVHLLVLQRVSLEKRHSATFRYVDRNT